MLSFSRQVINALWPEGSFWTPKIGSDYDKLLDGVADNSEAVRLDLKELAQLRNPRLTPILSDLEKEFAVIPSAGSTEVERRDRLRATMFKRSSPGTAEYLQASLRDAGFDGVYVYNNSPAADPRDFILQSFNMVCGDTLPSGNLAQCGEPEAICAELGGELIVNGDVTEMTAIYINVCGEPGIECNDSIYAGDFSAYSAVVVDTVYTVPADSGYWPLVFFIGGIATRDINGVITDIARLQILSSRRVEFRRLVLKYKPMFSWCALVAEYV